MNILELPMRGQDLQGAGWYKAPRGKRKHNGIDLVCEKDFIVESLTYGDVTKIGYPYLPSDEERGHLRYVEVTLDGNRFRYFYIHPLVQVGDKIMPNIPLGVSQDLCSIYTGITQHVHFEIIKPNGKHMNPSDMFPTIGTVTNEII